jgi:hypothetical protein
VGSKRFPFVLGARERTRTNLKYTRISISNLNFNSIPVLGLAPEGLLAGDLFAKTKIYYKEIIAVVGNGNEGLAAGI